MKTCSKCGFPKPFDEFHEKKGTSDGHQPVCKECVSNYGKLRYQGRKKAVRLENKIRRSARQEFVNHLKEHPCTDCGVQYEPVCMDFDHLSDKVKAVAIMARDGWSEDRILLEVQKCDLVCVLCHKTRTYFRRVPTVDWVHGVL